MIRLPILALLIALLGFVLAACTTPRGDNGGDDDDLFGDDDDSGGNADDDDATGSDDDDDDDDDATPAPESDCDNGLDDDGDTLTDCDDPDCADSFAPCSWPTEIGQTGDFNFDGYTIECEVVGIPVDVDVDDCRTTYSSTMGTDLTVMPCEACDRTFEGPLAYSEDSCAELLDTTSPGSASFGLVFTSATEWEFWAINADSGEWQSSGTATSDGAGNFLFSDSEVITGDPPDCDNGTQTLGNLTVTLSFRDASVP